MFKLTWSVIVVVLAISIASAAEIRFNEALFNQTDCSTTACSFAWNDQDSWIGGRVPRRNDDVFISDSPYEIEIHCPYYCEARSISGKNLFFNMTKMNALVNVTTFDVNSISFANGVLRSSLITANETVELDGVVTVNTGTLSVFASAFRLTDSDVDLVTLNASIIASYSSKLRVDSTLVVASEWSVENSTLRFYGTCQCPIDATSSSLIQASEVHVRASCSFCLDDVLAVLESRWIIENVPSANETATYELTSAEFEFSESTLLVADNVKLVINQIVTLADSQIESTNTIHLAQLGALKGSGRIVSSITADYSSILAPGSGDLTIYGLVTLDEGSTLLIDNGTLFVTTLQIFNDTKLSIAEGSTITELVVATDLIAGSFSEIELHLTSFQLVYNYTHIYIQMGVDNEPQSSEEPSSDAPHAVHQPYQQSPSSSVNPPSGEEAGTDGKLVAIVILSILLGMMTLAVAVLVFKMRQLQAGYMPLNSKVLPFADDDM